MEENKDKKFIIEATGEMPYASVIQGGYELLSNQREMKFIVKKQTVQDLENNITDSHFAVFCLVKEGDMWVHTDNSSVAQSITGFVKSINLSPYFTKAVDEYRKQLNITEEWR